MKFSRKLPVICLAFIFSVVILMPKGAFCITIKQEEELSREFMKVVLKHFEFIQDPVIVSYVNTIGKKIVSVLPPQNFKYQFYIIKEDVYNAFASPAGHIFINSGLIAAMENEEELAGILAHEIAHSLCRHISQKIERSKKIGLAQLAGMAAGIFLGASGVSTVAGAVTIGSMAAGESIALAYSREDEMQADQIGLRYLTTAGYNGTGLLTVLKKIRSKQWFGSDQVPTYMMTHPATEDRIAYIDTWLETHGKTKKETSRVTPDDFIMAHTRIVALYGEEGAAVRQFEAAVNKDPGNPMSQQGYGLVLARIGNFKDAAIHLKKALEKKAFDPNILQDLGRINFLDGKYTEALRTLEGAASISHLDPEGLFFLGRTRMELGRLKEAASTFEALIRKNSDYNQAYYFLGEIYGKQGNLGDAHYYLGIFYKNKENYKNADFHLRRALENINDPDKRVEIEKMLKKIRKKVLSQKREDTRKRRN